MDANYTFKKHFLSADQKLWLAEVARTSKPFSPREARLALQGRLSANFSPDEIDPRLYANRRLTPVGLWHVNSHHPQLAAIDKSISAIRERMLRDPRLKGVSAAEIAADAGMSEQEVGEALFAVNELGLHFFTQASGLPDNPYAYSQLVLPDDDSMEDEYLRYRGIEDLLERFYLQRGKALWGAVAYAEKIANEQHVATARAAELADSAVRSVYAAIENSIEYDGRAHSGNVPREAETILLNDTGGTIDPAEAYRLIMEAIASLSNAGKVYAPAERFKDWRIVQPQDNKTRELPDKKVFIVHGRDDGTKQTVARFIERLGLQPIILHERPNKGRTIITKFREESAAVGFAVVLMTPDDLGRAADDTQLKPRARQNVVFELGFFIGSLQPERVAALVKGDVEKPSDFDGVVYISLDRADWQMLLGQELKVAGYEFDWNKVLT